MTLEDAILYHNRNARLYEKAGWSQSAVDARQHVEWLTELRKLRNTRIRQLAEIHGLKDENARLRELVYEMHGAYVDMTKLYENSEHYLLWSANRWPEAKIKAELASFESRCEEDRHRFDEAMRELGIEVAE